MDVSVLDLDVFKALFVLHQAVVVHTFNLSTQEAETRQIFVSSRLATE